MPFLTLHHILGNEYQKQDSEEPNNQEPIKRKHEHRFNDNPMREKVSIISQPQIRNQKVILKRKIYLKKKISREESGK